MKVKQLVLLCMLSVFLFSCGSKKKAANRRGSNREMVSRRVVPAEVENNVRKNSGPVTYAVSVEHYIQLFAPIAMEEMKLYKIPASITLAQGILESGAGRGELSRRANNHFGIKCHDWKGAKVYHDDDRRQECFRKYNDPKYSYRDHSLFLAKRGRYADLFTLDADDYKGWARGLKKAGYATDRRYPDKLIDLVEKYQLYKFDEEVLGRPSRNYAELAEGNDTSTSTYVVKKGDTLYSISKRYNTTVAEIQRSNNLDGTSISIGQVLYIN
ncbi:glucosaminidase domain-containing protein [Autumnicola musiva]|uniref:Peptidoglycan hydrolase n=1 Tax=Autumnicola musiva TaxID=3075589 RepID=A0ABU3D239_9FLAO|nr:glucosaminidase domain-containing protein [Zunongwangia sp. F117]MDT0675611.1 glucosaminidase domain-containing protein [Zunongwangia sp. F117]